MPPPLPCVAPPVLNVIEPDEPDVDGPLLNSRFPDAGADNDAIVTSPPAKLFKSVLPDKMLTAPPFFTVLCPACTTTAPPTALFVEPTNNEIAPARPDDATPVASATQPELPDNVVPDDRDTTPDNVPAEPELRTTFPVAAADAPVATHTSPDVPVTVVPLLNTSEPDRDVSKLLADRT